MAGDSTSRGLYSWQFKTNSSSRCPTMPRSGSTHVARQLLKTTITFSDVPLKRASDIWSFKIFAAPLNKQNHQLVLSCGKVSHIGWVNPMSPCPLLSPGTQDTQSCWSSKRFLSLFRDNSNEATRDRETNVCSALYFSKAKPWVETHLGIMDMECDMIWY